MGQHEDGIRVGPGPIALESFRRTDVDGRKQGWMLTSNLRLTSCTRTPATVHEDEDSTTSPALPSTMFGESVSDCRQRHPNATFWSIYPCMP